MKWTVEWAWVPREPHLPKNHHKCGFDVGIEAESPVRAAELAFCFDMGRELQRESRVYGQYVEDEWSLEVMCPDRGWYSFSIRKFKPQRTPEQLMQNIYDLFYLDCDAKGDFYNPDKEVSGADFVEAVGEILKEFKPIPPETERG